MRKDTALGGLWILTENGMSIVDVSKFDEIFICDTGDNYLVSAAMTSRDSDKALLGRYARRDDAIEALGKIYEALREGRDTLIMLPNIGPEIHKKMDSRVKRKGGS